MFICCLPADGHSESTPDSWRVRLYSRLPHGSYGAGCPAAEVRSRELDPVAPVAYQVNLEPGIGQFREFEPRRLHTRINSLGLFLLHKLTCGKRESVS